MNARLRDRGPFQSIWVQPAAGDAGTALGAALWNDARERGSNERAWVMDHAFLGPSYSDYEIEQFLHWSKLPYRRLADVAGQTADLLVQDKVIGWFQGRIEFGPRALGARSILASPIHAEMQARLNDIKDREDFRPVAPVVLEEEAAHWFAGARVSPFMLFVFEVLPDKADRIPAVRHVDGTARIQTINRGQNPAYYDLLKAFQQRTSVPVLAQVRSTTTSPWRPDRLPAAPLRRRGKRGRESPRLPGTPSAARPTPPPGSRATAGPAFPAQPAGDCVPAPSRWDLHAPRGR
jgi:carbamoyltransferase